MPAIGPHKITEEFEKVISDYTKAPYCVAIDNCSNALFLALAYEGINRKKIGIPSRTYPSVPCEIIHAGGIVEFYKVEGKIKGEYRLLNTKVFDSALRFTSNMYRDGFTQCLSFSGPHKHLKLGKGGMILTDSLEAYKWYKKARFSGRGECSYHDDNFTMTGWNFYMLPEIAAKGIGLMAGIKEHNEDLELLYPDLSKFKIYKGI
jgi:dTDP-4-amino-4,6-dideoxygalactose transaminase